jgi:hypothetical protein
LSYETIVKLWFNAETVDRAEHQVQLCRRSDSDEALWLVAAAKQQLALIAQNGFMGFPLVDG